MLASSWKMCCKYGRFYDLHMLLMLVRSTIARRQGAAENRVFVTDPVSEFYGQMLYILVG
jgi:hypothetical protein